MTWNEVRRQRLLWQCAAWLEFLLATGCVGERKDQGVDQVLTAEIAKKALLEMDPKQIPTGVIVPGPIDAPITFSNGYEVSPGVWKCNLKEKTFHIYQGFPGAKRHNQNEVYGVFQRNQDGKWVAKVTESSSSH